MPILFLILILSFCRQQPYAADTVAVAFNPKKCGFAHQLLQDLIVLNSGQQSSGATEDSLSALKPRTIKITADCAYVVAPPIRSVISGASVLYKIEPLLSVDSVKLFVRHSQAVVDTLGVLESAPFHVIWNIAKIPSQDQIHLQFGYTLYVSDTLVITSPPMPHRYVRSDKSSPIGGSKARSKIYGIKQLTVNPKLFEVDGDRSKWEHVKGADIGDGSYFKLLWTSAKLYFIAYVRDSSITEGDFVELHLDMHRDRALFADINHRSLRFSPRSKRQSFVAQLKDDGFVYADSVNQLLADEAEWKAVMDSNGYIIETAIPFSLLSNLGFPPSKIGFDVSIMNVDGAYDKKSTTFHSWSGSEQFSRYSPRSWGTAKIIQAALTLKIVFIFVLIFTAAIPIWLIIHIFTANKARDKLDADIDALRSIMPQIVKDEEDEDDDENIDDLT